MPAAKVSRVGVRSVVILERRVDIAEMGIGGWVDVGGVGWSDLRRFLVVVSSVARIACCDGSRRDVSMSSGLDDGSDCRGFGCSVDWGCFGRGLILGIEGGRRSAFRACRSRCSLSVSANNTAA